MTTETKAIELAIHIGNDIKSLKETIGDPTKLFTNAKTLDGAISELQSELNALKSSNVIIEE